MAMSPDQQDVFFTLVVGGGPGAGEFVYDSGGNLRSSNVGQATTDPVQGVACPQGFATYNGHGAVINLLSTSAGGFFQYRDLGTAVQGALILSVASVAGNDPVDGTAYPVGLFGIDPVFGDTMAVVGATLNFQGGGASFTQSARVQANKGSVSIPPFMVLFAPEQGVSGHLVMFMAGTSPDGTVPAQLRLANEPTGFTTPAGVTKALLELQGALGLPNAALPAFVSAAFQLSSVLGVLTGITGSGGLSGTVPLDQVDHTTFTVTATGANQASKAWPIPANDANADTTYELEVWGTGTEGSTAQNLVVGAGVDGASIRTATAAALTLSGAFRFHVTMLLHVKTTGAGGTYDLSGNGTWDTTASPGVDKSFTFGSSASGGEALDTTVVHNFRLNLGWSSATGAPTITTLGSRFTRRGP